MQKGTLGKEIEFKYKASVEFTKFVKFCRKKFKDKELYVDGRDDFYYNNNDELGFIRHRYGKTLNQLTYKNKLFGDTNVVRVEHNINLDKNVFPIDISRLCASLGYSYNFSLRKFAVIFRNEDYNVVYYVCYDDQNRDIGRFIEIELSEEKDWGSRFKAVKYLKKIEKKFTPIGVSPKKRFKKSLWELFRK